MSGELTVIQPLWSPAPSCEARKRWPRSPGLLLLYRLLLLDVAPGPGNIRPAPWYIGPAPGPVGPAPGEGGNAEGPAIGQRGRGACPEGCLGARVGRQPEGGGVGVSLVIVTKSISKNELAILCLFVCVCVYVRDCMRVPASGSVR